MKLPDSRRHLWYSSGYTVLQSLSYPMPYPMPCPMLCPIYTEAVNASYLAEVKTCLLYRGGSRIQQRGVQRRYMCTLLHMVTYKVYLVEQRSIFCLSLLINYLHFVFFIRFTEHTAAGINSNCEDLCSYCSLPGSGVSVQPHYNKWSPAATCC